MNGIAERVKWATISHTLMFKNNTRNGRITELINVQNTAKAIKIPMLIGFDKYGNMFWNKRCNIIEQNLNPVSASEYNLEYFIYQPLMCFNWMWSHNKRQGIKKWSWRTRYWAEIHPNKENPESVRPGSNFTDFQNTWNMIC